KEIMSLVKDFQIDPVKDTFLHFDLLEVVPDKVINTKVPVKLVGKSKGVIEGGLLEELMHTLSVHAKAKDLPHEVVIDITNLGIGDSIHVKDIEPPKNVQFTDVPDSVIVLVAGVKAEEETTAPVVAEGEAPKAK
ncbi:MAG: 50S ribosomal protein L25, partial [Spirochaetae bacterium HGW-Spirochaetae-6]